MTPDISIVVPVFNEEPDILWLGLASLQNQTLRNFQCLLIDESSDTRTSEVCSEFGKDGRFRHIRPVRRLGLAASLNLGISLADSDFVARFDADDICVTDRLERQLSYLRSNPEIDVLGGALELMDVSGRHLSYRNYPLTHVEIARWMQIITPVAHPAVVFRRQMVIDAGSYDPGFRYAEDLDLWLRLLNRGAVFGNVPDVIVRYRTRGSARNFSHWRHNLKARMRNWSPRLLPWRLVGLATCVVALVVPPKVRKALLSVLNSHRPHDKLPIVPAN